MVENESEEVKSEYKKMIIMLMVYQDKIIIFKSKKKLIILVDMPKISNQIVVSIYIVN